MIFLPSVLSPRTCVGRRTVPWLWTAGPAFPQAFSNQLSERSVDVDFILRTILGSPRNLGSCDGGEEEQEKEKRKIRKSEEGEKEQEEAKDRKPREKEVVGEGRKKRDHKLSNILVPVASSRRDRYGGRLGNSEP